MTLKSLYVCLSRKLALFLTVKYHAKISGLNLKKYLTIKIDCNSRPKSLFDTVADVKPEYISDHNLQLIVKETNDL